MTIHIKATYKDGYKDVEYCRICGREGEALLLDCPGKLQDQQDFFDKKLDSTKEQD